MAVGGATAFGLVGVGGNVLARGVALPTRPLGRRTWSSFDRVRLLRSHRGPFPAGLAPPGHVHHAGARATPSHGVWRDHLVVDVGTFLLHMDFLHWVTGQLLATRTLPVIAR